MSSTFVMLADISCFLCYLRKRGFSMTSEGNIYQVCRRLLHAGYGSPWGIAARVPPLASWFVNTMTEKGLCRREQDCEQPKNDMFLWVKQLCTRGRSSKKWEIVHRIMEEQGRRIFHFAPSLPT